MIIFNFVNYAYKKITIVETDVIYSVRLDHNYLWWYDERIHRKRVEIHKTKR